MSNNSFSKVNYRHISAFASRDMLLPDIGMVHGRMIVTAWDYGLDKVEDNAVRLLMKAVEVCGTCLEYCQVRFET